MPVMPTSGCEIVQEYISTTTPVTIDVPESMLGIWVYATDYLGSTLTHNIKIEIQERQAGITTPFLVRGIASATFTIPSNDLADQAIGSIICIPW